MLNESCDFCEKYMRIPTETARRLYFHAQWAGTFSCSDDFMIKRSNMDSFLLLFTQSGRGMLHFENKIYQIEKNSIVFLDCQLLQHYYTVEAPWQFKFIHFNGPQAKAYYSFLIQLYGNPVFPCPVPQIETLFDRVIDSMKSVEDEATSSLHLYRILTSLISQNHRSDDFSVFKQIMDYMSDNYSKKLDVSTIASSFNFSRSYFTSRFTEFNHISPAKYLKNCRLMAAKELLSNTNDTVEQIAEQCGFTSNSVFIRLFKKEMGCTPYYYRKNHSYSYNH